MSNLRVASLRGRKVGTAPILPDGAVITGIVTTTSFSGNGSGLSGIDATALKDSGGSVKVQANTSGVNITGVSSATQFSGNITGTTGTFTGNVSVGAVLTYDDVTNIDSVGVVTARAGIKIGAGQSVSAVSGIVTYYGDGSKLSGVESGVVNFVASGTIANGQTVVINTDGTVGIVTATTSNTPSAGAAVQIDSTSYSSVTETTCVYDSTNQKVVIAYQDRADSNKGKVVVGTVSGTSISFGTPVVFESSGATELAAIYDSTNSKVVIFYNDSGNSSKGTAIVGTVSGTSISFGSAAIFNNNTSGQYYNQGTVYYTSNQKIVTLYRDQGNNNYFTYVVGTVSGTSISFSSPAVLLSIDLSSNYSTIYDPDTNQIVLVFRDASNSNYGTARTISLSGSTLSLASSSVFRSANVYGFALSYDTTNNKVVIAFKGPGERGEAVVGTVSGTSISYGTHVVFGPSSEISEINVDYDSTNGKVVISYRDQVNINGSVVTGTVSGTSISFSSAAIFYSTTRTYENSSTYDSSNDKVVVAYSRGYNPSGITASVITSTSQTTNLTAENYIGIAAEAISNTATGKITVVGGTNTGQTGLTTAQKYFVQTNGTLSTSAGDPSVVAGTAISDTKIIVQKS